jgi:hypothetical protein
MPPRPKLLSVIIIEDAELARDLQAAITRDVLGLVDVFASSDSHLYVFQRRLT